MSKLQKILYSVLIVIIMTGIATALYMFFNKEELAPDDVAPTETFSDYAISYEENGFLHLYDVETEKKIDVFELTSISKPVKKESAVPFKEKVEEKVEKKPETAEKVEKKEATAVNETGPLKEFEEIRVKVTKHDNAWNIQSALTPKRDTLQMLALVRESNNGYDMHPIYPNQEYVFLVEKDSVRTKEEEAAIGIEVTAVEKEEESLPEEKEEPAEEVVATEDVPTQELAVADETYIFYRDKVENRLYAYSDLDEIVYEILPTEAGKIQVTEHFATGDIGNPKRFIVAEDQVVFHTTAKEITYFSSKEKKAKSIKLHAEPEQWIYSNGHLVYTFEDNIGNVNLETLKGNHALLGDVTNELLELNGKIYALNVFGQGKDNSLLMMIEPESLYVDNLLELNTSNVHMISHGSNKLFLSAKQTDGSEKGIFVNEASLTIQPTDWDLEYAADGMVEKNTLYVTKTDGNTLNVYEVGSTEATKSIAFEGANIMVYPQVSRVVEGEDSNEGENEE